MQNTSKASEQDPNPNRMVCIILRSLYISRAKANVVTRIFQSKKSIFFIFLLQHVSNKLGH